MTVRHHFISICLLALLFGCVPEGMEDVNTEYPGLKHLTFKESKKVFPNPERGFDAGLNWFSASDRPLTKQFLTAQRLLNRTVLYTGYYLTDYMESDIAPEFLDLISANMPYCSITLTGRTSVITSSKSSNIAFLFLRYN